MFFLPHYMASQRPSLQTSMSYSQTRLTGMVVVSRILVLKDLSIMLVRDLSKHCRLDTNP